MLLPQRSRRFPIVAIAASGAQKAGLEVLDQEWKAVGAGDIAAALGRAAQPAIVIR